MNEMAAGLPVGDAGAGDRVQSDHGTLYPWRRKKGPGRNDERAADISVNAADDAQLPKGRITGRGADAICHLLLEHQDQT